MLPTAHPTLLQSCTTHTSQKRAKQQGGGSFLTHHKPLQKSLTAEPLGKGGSVLIIRRGTAFKRGKDVRHTQRQTVVSRGVRAVSNTSQRDRTSSKCRAAVPARAPEGMARQTTF